jgi:hypothetical protein
MHRERLLEDFAPFVAQIKGPPEITIDIGESPRDQSGPSLWAVSGPLGDAITCDATGRISISGPRIASDAAYLPEVRSYFAAVVLQRLVDARTVQQVHASGVVGSRGAVLFAGDRGAGKTSLALAATLAGARYLSNDIALIERDVAEVRVLGLPQSLTLGPGAASWFDAHYPQLGLPASLAGQELPDKVRLGCGTLALDPGPAALSGLIFPERMDVLAMPRAQRLETGEALVRLVSVTEAIMKWQLPPALVGDAYFERLQYVCEAAVQQAEAWHFQWCSDHELNVALLRELVL